MIVTGIQYSKRFEKEWATLPDEIKKKVIIKISIFKKNPLHPSLRLHQLKGRFQGVWSVSITKGYRAIFERQENTDILFVSVGTHDIYKHL